MRITKIKSAFSLACCAVVIPFFIACDNSDWCLEPTISNYYSLINNTAERLDYESSKPSGVGTWRLNRLLPSGDTLLLYRSWNQCRNSGIANDFYYTAESATVMIKDNEGLVLFYRSGNITCGSENFVPVQIDSVNTHWFWHIDSAYIAEKACNIPWDEFQERLNEN